MCGVPKTKKNMLGAFCFFVQSDIVGGGLRLLVIHYHCPSPSQLVFLLDDSIACIVYM